MGKFDLSSLFKKEKKLQSPVPLKKNNTRCHLIVDDSDVNRLVLKKYLKNFTCDEATNGQNAITLVKQDFSKYDYIWMDVKMPVMDGIEATQILRKLGYKNNIVGITGMVDTKTNNKCIDAGMNKVIAKPIELAEILMLVKD